MVFLPQEILRKKRLGQTLAADEIADFIAGFASGAVSEAQIGAFAMAVCINDMDAGERVALTLAMRDSGTVLDWSHLHGPIADKHSTGGIGDNVSLMLAPILAACGAYVPMISGRGLGHSGGTLDKLDAIPGYQTRPDKTLFRQTVGQAGCAIVGQTADLAPADGRLYAIRDVTGTVENIALITASILSKKLAAGLDALVLDVKTGNGAFMQTLETSRELARAMVEVANGAGVKTTALITDMNEPLASAAGNALETRNAVHFLTGIHCDPRLREVVLELAAMLLEMTGLTADHAAGKARAEAALTDGRAAERFAQMVTALGGPADFIEHHETYLETAPIIREVLADKAGVVTSIDLRTIGMGVVAMGGGRLKPTDTIDYAVGFDHFAGLGKPIEKGSVLARVHARNEAGAEEGERRIRAAYAIGENAAAYPLIAEKIVPEALN